MGTYTNILLGNQKEMWIIRPGFMEADELKSVLKVTLDLAEKWTPLTKTDIEELMAVSDQRSSDQGNLLQSVGRKEWLCKVKTGDILFQCVIVYL